MSKLNQQLKKGALEILILRVIERSDVYGYELIKTLEENSDGYFTLKEGSLYPILYRLEDKGFIESYKKSFEGERKIPRKYYKITQVGREALDEMIDTWHEFKGHMENMI